MRKATWKIIDRGKVPEIASHVDYTCECGHEAQMPVMSECRKQFDDYLAGPLEADVPDEFHERLVLLGLRKS